MSQTRQDRSTYMKEWRQRNKDRCRLYANTHRLKYPEKVQARKKVYYDTHRQELLAKAQQYAVKNRDRLRIYKRLWKRQDHHKHPEHYRTMARAYYAKHRIRLTLRRRIYYALHQALELQYAAMYREKNRVRLRLRDKASRQMNLARARAYDKQYRQEHLEQDKLKQKTYRQTHPEVKRDHQARRRARKAMVAVNDLSQAQWLEILIAYDYRCAYCHRQMKRLTQDHITPLIANGCHTLHNIVPACQTCNSKKHAGPPLSPVQPLLLTIAPAACD